MPHPAGLLVQVGFRPVPEAEKPVSSPTPSTPMAVPAPPRSPNCPWRCR